MTETPEKTVSIADIAAVCSQKPSHAPYIIIEALKNNGVAIEKEVVRGGYSNQIPASEARKLFDDGAITLDDTKKTMPPYEKSYKALQEAGVVE